MALSNPQVERYSRQIIVPKIGGVGQEHLLAARLLLAGETADLEATLAYLAGAGVGTIFLRPSGGNPAVCAQLISRRGELNPEVKVTIVPDIPENLRLLMVVATSARAVEDVRGICAVGWNAPMVFVRAGEQTKIAILPSRPPCPSCADAALLTLPVRPDEHTSFVTMVAAVEALKILAHYGSLSNPMLIEFDGYASRMREINSVPAATDCACASLATGGAG